jgi:cysteine-rich repeat protein
LAWSFVAALALAGCGGSSGKAAGAEGGPCFGNSTCNAGLTCASNLCVQLPGVGGAGGSGQAGNGAAGASGQAGNGVAGASGQAGSGVAGARGQAGKEMARAGGGNAGGGGSPSDATSCGNGAPDPGEACDDGNRMGGDGCTSLCQIEVGYACPTANQPCVRSAKCGDGVVEPPEECDDGNSNNGDGCSFDCLAEVGWSCPTAGAPCIGSCAVTAKCGNVGSSNVCGDGIVGSGEQCDCGAGTVPVPANCPGPNGATYGGCTTSCTFGAHCGDGIVDPPEVCDPGQSPSDYGLDGCTGSCQRARYCGDGVVDADDGEQCDFGADNGGSYGGLSERCSADCQIEICLDVPCL